MPPDSLQTTPESTGLFLVSERLPGEREAWQRLFKTRLSCQSPGADYRDGLTALKCWQESTSGEAPVMAGTYGELLQKLEEEVRQYLDDEIASGAGRS
jgi:hypothetical protein